jgi:alkaline phosphatase
MKAKLLFFFFITTSIFAQKRPKNIILLIGDGMGTAQVFAGLTANKGTLNMGRCTHFGYSKTQSASSFVTDSGAGGTALAIGHKTKNGMVGVDATGVAQPTILELAKQNGKATGLVVTCSITHATPADFYAHQGSRSSMEAIADDLLKSDMDVFVGGGRKYFDQRKDNKNLVEELKNKGYQIADSTQDVAQFTQGKLAYFSSLGEPIKYSAGRGDILPNGVKTALNLLSKNKKGFFMMVEGSQIDWAGHANNTADIVAETLDFDRAVGAALDFAQKDGKTLVIITADHETGGFAVTGGDMTTGKVEGKFTSTGHTGVMVPVMAYGPGAEVFSGIYENTDVFQKMKAAFRF